MFAMDGDLKYPPSEQRPHNVAEKNGLQPRSSADNPTRPPCPPRIYILRRWFVRLWCVVGALFVGYLFSYLVSSNDHELRFFLFAVVSIGLAIAACGVAEQVDLSRD